MAGIITIERGHDLSCENKIKNKFKWSWLEEKDKYGDFFSSYIRKTNVGGHAWCTLCKCVVNYGSSGKKRLHEHADSGSHKKKRAAQQNQTKLPSSFMSPSTSQSECHFPYGAASNVKHDDVRCAKSAEEPPEVSMVDRRSHAEGRTLAFLAEQGLPLRLVPHLISYAKEMARDSQVLSTLHMERTTASYKLREGLGQALHDTLVKKLTVTFFSINSDECTSTANEKVFSVLVCFFDESKGESVTEPLLSAPIKRATAKIVTDVVTKKFTEENIPLANLISSLSDSANYMRGKISGFETQLRSLAPHLLDIDGDVCHHVHNIVKKFCAPFGREVERLCDDMYTEFKFGPDVREYAQDISSILDIHYRTPLQRVPHRWLSVFDTCAVIVDLMPVVTVLYYPFVSKDLQGAYEEVVDNLLEKCTDRSKKTIKEIQRQFKLKGSTSEGKDRKERIVERLFYQRDKTDVHLSFYMECLPIFKSFVLIFQKAEPMVHTLHDELRNLTDTFLACFVKRDKVKKMKSSDLKKLDLHDTSIMRPTKDIYVGSETEKLLNKIEEKVGPAMEMLSTLPVSVPGSSRVTFPEQFRNKALEAYQSAGKMLLSKFPIANSLLRRLSALDPRVLGNDSACKAMQRLKLNFPTVIKEEDYNPYDLECSRINVANDLPPVGDTFRLDHWWWQVMKKGQYPYLSKVVKAALSIFTGPKIESSFSGLNDIVDKKSNRLHVETYHAYMQVRYSLKSKNASALDVYHRQDNRKSPVDRIQCHYLQTAHGRYKRKMVKRQEEQEERRRAMGVESSKSTQKKQVNDVHQKAKQIKRKILSQSKRRAPVSKKPRKV